jgi:hypothetical protein
MGSRAAGELASRKGNFERDPSAGRQGNIRSTRKRILDEGRNCWRIAEAGRAAFLVDAAAYFDAFVSAVMKARESILILAWDIDSRVRLKRDDRDHGLPKELGNFLDAIISRRRGLHAHIPEKIAEFRSRLLAEHLGTSPGKVAEAIAAKESMIEAIEVHSTPAARIASDHLPIKASIDVKTSPAVERRRIAPPPELLGTPAG